MLRKGQLSFKAFISSSSQIMKKKRNIRTNIAIRFCIKRHASKQGLLNVSTIFTIISYATNFSFSDKSNFIYTLANVFISGTINFKAPSI